MNNWWLWLLNVGVYGFILINYILRLREIESLKKELHMSNFMYSNLLIDHIALKRKKGEGSDDE